MTNNAKLDSLYDSITTCQRCKLAKLEVNKERIRNKIGVNNILIISQNPSHIRTNRLGDEFVMGGFDKLVSPTSSDKLFKLLEKCYITNIIKCSFTNNKSPDDAHELAGVCIDWLLDEVRIIKPELIIVVGSLAKECLPTKKIFEIVPKVNIMYVKHPSYYIYKREQEVIIKTMIDILSKYSTTQMRIM